MEFITRDIFFIEYMHLDQQETMSEKSRICETPNLSTNADRSPNIFFQIFNGPGVAGAVLQTPL